MKSRNPSTKPPVVSLVGHIDHPDFRDAVGLLKTEAEFVAEGQSPELLVIAQSRPGAISEHDLVGLRRNAPLAGVVGLLGSWCEGETRTGTPWPGVPRVYWYDFPAWWRRQLTLRAAGRCPDWARPEGLALQTANNESQRVDPTQGVIVLCTHWRDTADALADVVAQAGYATIWQHPFRLHHSIRGVTAGIWVGGQLDPAERPALKRFCGLLARDSAPIVALLDFPRRHSVDLAGEFGAAAVLGKPWRNEELIATIQTMFDKVQRLHAA